MGHGRIEIRELELVSLALDQRIKDFEDIVHVARITRVIEYKNGRNKLRKNKKNLNEINQDEVETENGDGNRVTTQTVYYVTTALSITAEEFLDINRAHWGIETGLFYGRDFSYLEDRQILNKGNSGINMVSFRNFSIGLKNRIKIDYLPNSFNFFEKNKDFLLKALQPNCRGA